MILILNFLLQAKTGALQDRSELLMGLDGGIIPHPDQICNQLIGFLAGHGINGRTYDFNLKGFKIVSYISYHKSLLPSEVKYNCDTHVKEFHGKRQDFGGRFLFSQLAEYVYDVEKQIFHDVNNDEYPRIIKETDHFIQYDVDNFAMSKTCPCNNRSCNGSLNFAKTSICNYYSE